MSACFLPAAPLTKAGRARGHAQKTKLLTQPFGCIRSKRKPGDDRMENTGRQSPAHVVSDEKWGAGPATSCFNQTKHRMTWRTEGPCRPWTTEVTPREHSGLCRWTGLSHVLSPVDLQIPLRP